MAKSDPITGPFPDGDSRNITLTPSDNSIEPKRSGPQEPAYREEGAPDTVMGGLLTDTDGSEMTISRATSDDSPEFGEEAEPYRMQESEEPGAAETAFSRPSGPLEAPVIQDDWNPAERNSDDLSR